MFVNTILAVWKTSIFDIVIALSLVICNAFVSNFRRPEKNLYNYVVAYVHDSCA